MSKLFSIARKVFVWQQLGYVMTFVRSIVLMRLISPDAYGLFALATMASGYVGLLRAFDFRAPIIASKEKDPSLLSTQYLTETGLCGFNLLLGVVLSPWLVTQYGSVAVFAILALLLAEVVDGFSSTPLYLKERNLEFSFLTRARTLISVGSFVVCVIMAWKGFGLWALVTDRVLMGICMAIWVWGKTDWRPSWQWRSDQFRYLAGFGFVLFCCGMVGKVLFGFDLFMLGTYWNETVLGFYSRAMAMARLPMEVGSGFLSMMALAFYSQGRRDSEDSTAGHYAEMTFNIARSSMWMVGVMSLLFANMVPLVFGKRWEPMIPYFMALIPYAVVRPLFQNAAQCLVALHYQKFLLACFSGLSTVYAIALVACVGHDSIWIAWISGIILVAGYFLLEWRVKGTLGDWGWKKALSPFLLLASALIAGVCVRKIGLSYAQEIVLNVIVATIYSMVVFLEWKRASPQVLRSPTS